MEDGTRKTEKCRRILMALTGIFLFAALCCLVWDIVHYDAGGLRTMWPPLALANVLQCCAKRKENPKLYTGLIVLWTLLFLLSSAFLLFTLFA